MCCFACIFNIVTHIKGRISVKSVWEQGSLLKISIHMEGNCATEIHLAGRLIFAWLQKWKFKKSLINVVGRCKLTV
jgi:hypothetical protein